MSRRTTWQTERMVIHATNDLVLKLHFFVKLEFLTDDVIFSIDELGDSDEGLHEAAEKGKFQCFRIKLISLPFYLILIEISRPENVVCVNRNQNSFQFRAY